MKPGRKTALKLFDERDNQKAYEMCQKVPGGYIEHRIGKSVRMRATAPCLDSAHNGQK